MRARDQNATEGDTGSPSFSTAKLVTYVEGKHTITKSVTLVFHNPASTMLTSDPVDTALPNLLRTPREFVHDIGHCGRLSTSVTVVADFDDASARRQ